MRLVSPVLRQVVYPLLASAGYFRHLAAQGDLCVLTYHGILPQGYRSTDPVLDGNLLSAQAFQRQLRWLKAHFQVIASVDFSSWLAEGRELPSRAVLLTCDDGLVNQLTDMVPILRDEDLSCLFFVTQASVGTLPRMLWYEELYLILMAAPQGPAVFDSLEMHTYLREKPQRRILWWDLVRRLSRLQRDARLDFVASLRRRIGFSDEQQEQDGFQKRFFMMTRAQLEKLAQAGMTVGAHTVSHPVLAEQSDESALAEMIESRQALESMLGRRIWAFSYPFGEPSSVRAREIACAERAGFECAFVNWGGGFGARLSRYAIPRVHITANMQLSELEAHMSGFYRRLRRPQVVAFEAQPVAGRATSL